MAPAAFRQNELATVAVIFGAVPLIAASFPALLHVARTTDSATVNNIAIGAIVVGKRAYLYTMAGLTVALAAQRGAEDDSALGTRLQALTYELLQVSSTFQIIEYEVIDTPSNM